MRNAGGGGRRGCRILMGRVVEDVGLDRPLVLRLRLRASAALRGVWCLLFTCSI